MSDRKIEEFISFVRSINREDVTVQETVDAIVKQESTLTADEDIFIFRDAVYEWLWVEPESLRQRRMNGELDKFFVGDGRGVRIVGHKIDKRPPFPKLEWQWYSMCSRHMKYDPECGSCSRGEWISDNEREFDNWLWTLDQDIWRKWANRNNVSGWREYFRKNKW